ncbi:MAG: hypothetical protein IPH13_08350 [Planctomycetes bacterium]|nr:hypothetical protein [Planctomycetota bacterium]
MNCTECVDLAVHVLLGQEATEIAARWHEHRKSCSACGAEAARVAELLKRVRSYDAPPTRATFRTELRERLTGLGYDDLLREARPRDRVAARWAWVRHRVRTSTAVKLALAAAAVVVVSAVAWQARDERGTLPGELVGLAPAQPESPSAPIENAPATTPAPAVEPSPPPRGASRADVAFGAPDEVQDKTLAETAIDPTPPLPPDVLERLELATERLNRFATARHLLRKRLRGEADDGAGLSPAAETAMRDATRWLLDQQFEDGSFDPARFEGQPEARVGVTALAMLALQRGGVRGVPTGLLAQRVTRGMDWLRSTRDDAGTLGMVKGADAVTLFNHAAATMAFAERYVLSGRVDEALLSDAVLRLDDLNRQRQGREAQDGDVVAARFAALALEAARSAGVPTVLNLDRVVAQARAEFEGSIDTSLIASGSLPVPQFQAAVTAGAIDPYYTAAPVLRATTLPVPTVMQVLERPELREPSLLFCATIDLHARGGAGWATFEAKLLDELAQTQQRNGSFRAEYAFDAVGRAGGVLYETALGVLTLGVPVRVAK